MSSIRRLACPSCHGSSFETDEKGNLVCTFCGTTFASPREEIQCPTCGTMNPPEARRCMDCGRVLGTICPACSYENIPGADHCARCGNPLDTLTSILARQDRSGHIEQMVATKARDDAFMREQRARLEAEERERLATIAAHQKMAAREQQRILLIGAGMLLIFLVVLAVILFSSIGG